MTALPSCDKPGSSPGAAGRQSFHFAGARSGRTDRHTYTRPHSVPWIRWPLGRARSQLPGEPFSLPQAACAQAASLISESKRSGTEGRIAHPMLSFSHCYSPVASQPLWPSFWAALPASSPAGCPQTCAPGLKINEVAWRRIKGSPEKKKTNTQKRLLTISPHGCRKVDRKIHRCASSGNITTERTSGLPPPDTRTHS